LRQLLEAIKLKNEREHNKIRKFIKYYYKDVDRKLIAYDKNLRAGSELRASRILQEKVEIENDLFRKGADYIANIKILHNQTEMLACIINTFILRQIKMLFDKKAGLCQKLKLYYSKHQTVIWGDVWKELIAGFGSLNELFEKKLAESQKYDSRLRDTIETLVRARIKNEDISNVLSQLRMAA